MSEKKTKALEWAVEYILNSDQMLNDDSIKQLQEIQGLIKTATA